MSQGCKCGHDVLKHEDGIGCAPPGRCQMDGCGCNMYVSIEIVAGRYRKKPLVVYARKATKEEQITTLEGTMTARLGDWIITDVKGEKYPCKPDIFEATYEPDAMPSLSEKCEHKYVDLRVYSKGGMFLGRPTNPPADVWVCCTKCNRRWGYALIYPQDMSKVV